MSAAVGVGTWITTGQEVAVPLAVAAGVLPDADHLLDYYMWWVKRERRFLILFLHGWEYLLLGIGLYLFIFREPWFLAVVLGYATQVGGDQLFNGARWHTYLITVRATRGFRASKAVIDEAIPTSANALISSLPFGRNWARRWFDKRR
jgi:hypothetical protein